MENHKIEIDLNINISENGKVTKCVKSKDIKPLSAYTVAEIKEIEKRGEVEKYFKVGDKLDIKLDNDEILTVAIADFYHDTDENGNLVPITFTAVNLLEESCSMDDMDEYLENLFSKRLPADIRDSIIPVQKDGKTYKLFLHSEMEIFGRTIYSNDNTGKQYPYYAENATVASSRIARSIQNGGGSVRLVTATRAVSALSTATATPTVTTLIIPMAWLRLSVFNRLIGKICPRKWA